MAQNYTYTAADFERYHSGKMSAMEMHAIEKAALQDPFIADALEGYVHTNTPVKDVAELKEKLFAKRKKKNVFFLMTKQKAWLRIAAMFIVMAGIGYLAYQLDFNKEDKVVAIKQDSALKETATQPATLRTDSLANQDGSVTAISTTKNQVRTLKSENKLPKPDMQISQDVAEGSTGTLLREPILKSAPSSPVQRDERREMNIVKGIVVDSSGNAVSHVTIRADGNLRTATDSAGKFKLITKDSVITATVTGIGYRSQKARLSNNNEQVIVLEASDKSLNETVVVTALGIRRSEKVLGYATQKKKSVAENDADSTSQPVTVWQEFTKYVQKNINIPRDDAGKNYKGKIVLSFEINKRGKPKNIKVEQSLCKPCDEEAIRLLKHGPKWKYTDDKRQRVTIEF